MLTRLHLALIVLPLSLGSCSTAPVTKSAMGLQPVESSQLVIHKAEVRDGKLYVAGLLVNPLNTINRAKVSHLGATARITMTQAMLRSGGSQDFSATVILKPKTRSVVIGKDRREIWNRERGVTIDPNNTADQMHNAIGDLSSRVEGVLRAFD